MKLFFNNFYTFIERIHIYNAVCAQFNQNNKKSNELILKLFPYEQCIEIFIEFLSIPQFYFNGINFFN